MRGDTDVATKRGVARFVAVIPIVVLVALSVAHLARLSELRESSRAVIRPDDGLIPRDAWVVNYEQINEDGERLIGLTIAEHATSMATVAGELPEALAGFLVAQLGTLQVGLLDRGGLSVSTIVIQDGNEAAGQVNEFSVRLRGDNRVLLTRFGSGVDYAYDPPLRYPTNSSPESSWSEAGEIVGRGRYQIAVEEKLSTEIPALPEWLKDCRHFEIAVIRDFGASGRESSKTLDTYCESQFPELSNDLVAKTAIRAMNFSTTGSEITTEPSGEAGGAIPNSQVSDAEISSIDDNPGIVIEPRWKMDVRFPSVITGESVVIFDSASRRLLAHSRATGDFKWSHVVQPEVVGICGHSGGTVVATVDRKAWSFSHSGKLQWVVSLPDIPLLDCTDTGESLVVVAADGSVIEFETARGMQLGQTRLPFLPVDTELIAAGRDWRHFALSAGGELIMHAPGQGPRVLSPCGASSRLRKWSELVVVCANETYAQFIDIYGKRTAEYDSEDASFFSSLTEWIPLGTLDIAILRGEELGWDCPLNEYCLLTEIRGEEGRDRRSVTVGASRPYMTINRSEIVLVANDGTIRIFGAT
jgi:hypothetical protein